MVHPPPTAGGLGKRRVASATTGGFVISISVVIVVSLYVSAARNLAQNTYISYTNQS